MRRSIVLLLVLAIMLVLAAPTLAPAKTKRRHAPTAHAPREIACTVIGCVPVPRGCFQRPAKNWYGDPIGMDEIVCPPGVPPFR